MTPRSSSVPHRRPGRVGAPAPSTGRRIAALASLLVCGCLAAQAQSPEVRVRAALAAAAAVDEDATTMVSTTVDLEGRPVFRLIEVSKESSGGTRSERHLTATLARTPSSPRSPQAERTTTVGLIPVDGASDGTSSPGLRVEVGSAALEIGGTAAASAGAGSSFAGVDPGASVDALVAPLVPGPSARLVDAISRVQGALRFEFTRDGTPCSTAAAILPQASPERVLLELASRCGTGDARAFTLRLDNLSFNGAGTLIGALLIPTGGSLDANETGRLHFVPTVLRGQTWDDGTPGLVTQDLALGGIRQIDFASLAEGADTPDCTPDATTLCLDHRPGDRRFRVTLSWFTAANGGLSGDAFATPLADVGLEAGGLFSFFEGNPEFLIKVLDGCALTGHFWLFGAPTTTLGFRLEVEDLVAKAAGRSADDYLLVIENVDGVTASSFSLLQAFPACDL